MPILSIIHIKLLLYNNITKDDLINYKNLKKQNINTKERINIKNKIKKILNDNGDKLKIIDIFIKNIKNKKSDVSTYNTRHCGKEGHWLEKLFGISANYQNSPDIFGYELKNDTKYKTTFGDWTADYYIFNDKMNKLDFFKLFGQYNSIKQRYSWSGQVIPKINTYNNGGQILEVDNNHNIIISYNYKYDLRGNKANLIPQKYQKNKILLVMWNHQSIKKKLENKFNIKGWFKCFKNPLGKYKNIAFADKINFDNWIKDVKCGKIFFDSGMYETNNRKYSQWRAYNSYWNNKIIEVY